MRATNVLMAALVAVAVPLSALAQGTPGPQDLELKAKKKTTVVQPGPAPGEAAKEAEAVKKRVEDSRRTKEAVKGAAPSRPDSDVTGGVQTKRLKPELK
jgi:hypothetical protein